MLIILNRLDLPSLSQPERAMPADALAVHGLTAEFLADKPLFGDLADEFLRTCPKIKFTVDK